MISEHVPLVDRATRAALTDLSAYCWLLYAIGPVTLLLRSEQGWSRSIAGAHATAMALGFVIAGLVTRRLPTSISVSAARRCCLGAIAIACIGLASAQASVASLAAAAIAGTAGALLVNLMNPQLVRHHGSQSAAALALVNAAGATAGAFAPLMVGFAASSNLGWRGLMWMLAMCVGVLALRKFTALGAVQALTPPPGFAMREHSNEGRSSIRFWMATVALLGGQIIEFTTSLFAADVIHSKVDVSIAVSARLGAGFLVGFAAGRWLATYLSRRYETAHIMIASLIVTSMSTTVVATSSSLTGMVIGLVLIGLGAGPCYPLLIALALRCTTVSAQKASGTIGALSGAVVAVAPFSLGALADRTNLSVLFLTLSGTAIVSAACLARGFVYASNTHESA